MSCKICPNKGGKYTKPSQQVHAKVMAWHGAQQVKPRDLAGVIAILAWHGTPLATVVHMLQTGDYVRQVMFAAAQKRKRSC